MKNMSSIERNLFSKKVTDVHPVIPVLTLQFVEELCGLIVESFISVILRDGTTNTMTVNILFVVFPWTGHLSHLDPFSCPLVPSMKTHPSGQRQDHPLIVTGVWLIHPTLIHLPESFIIPPNTSQPPTAALGLQNLRSIFHVLFFYHFLLICNVGCGVFFVTLPKGQQQFVFSSVSVEAAS